ncbi:MAG: hypothetical protein JWM12_2775 [Ilumatobacteraceae bacterium]|nr:hypothetical protein [Ilumatobacteraceae bacterium]
MDEAVGFFVPMERTCEAHLRAPGAVPIGHEAASAAGRGVGSHHAGWHYFQWLLRSGVADPTVVTHADGEQR